MRRSDFLKMAGTGALIAAVQGLTASCKTTEGPSNTVDSRTFTSSTDSNHTHTVTIQKTEVDAPPAAGINRQTSSGGGHTHAFVMTQAELQGVQNGTPVNVTTGQASGHTHVFTIAKWY